MKRRSIAMFAVMSLALIAFQFMSIRASAQAVPPGAAQVAAATQIAPVVVGSISDVGTALKSQDPATIIQATGDAVAKSATVIAGGTSGNTSTIAAQVAGWSSFITPLLIALVALFGSHKQTQASMAAANAAANTAANHSAAIQAVAARIPVISTGR